MRCEIWYHCCNLRNVENTYGRVLKKSCNYTKSDTPPWVFFTFFKRYKWCQIGQSITYWTLQCFDGWFWASKCRPRIHFFLLTLDLVPVSSLAAGADECWGMIIFNEDYLLYDADKVSTSWVVRIARTIAHEMSHLVRRNKIWASVLDIILKYISRNVLFLIFLVIDKG